MNSATSECEDGASAGSNLDGARGVDMPVGATDGSGGSGGAIGAGGNSLDGGSKRKRVSLACNACRLRKSKV